MTRAVPPATSKGKGALRTCHVAGIRVGELIWSLLFANVDLFVGSTRAKLNPFLAFDGVEP